ncbi:phosphotransferase [Solibacillus sp. FSL H8-0523]|uniref:phosphotransferase n=1 Tax=Solibacillus sp. FSL H8-0523 TaxID=2954511 RepID=UPI00310169A3
MAHVIKENCWKWDAKDGAYFMKYYDDYFLAQKVTFVHEQLEKQQFKYHIPLEWNEDAHILKQRWFEGKSADYRKVNDQKKVLKALQALHETKNQINWQQHDVLPIYDLHQKWQRRFERFVENEVLLKELLSHHYNEVVREAAHTLNQLALFNAHESMTILHGDVVHHNSMISNRDVVLVDFDLAALGEASDELILWMHRVLSQTNYDLVKLMKDHPYLQTARHKLVYLNFPNEIMRESLFYLKLNERQKLACYPFIQSIVAEWLHYKETLKNTIQTMTH